MAPNRPHANDRPDAAAPTCRRCDVPDRRPALAVLLTGRPDPDQPAVDHFLNFAQQQNLSLDGLWAAYDGPDPVYAALIIPGVGRTAVLFVAPVRNRTQSNTAISLIAKLLAAQPPDDLRLIQALLEPTQTREQQALHQAGFQELASLIYMRRSCIGFESPHRPEEPVLDAQGRALTALTWRDDRHDMFARAIDASYRDTLDCPALVGVRRMDDIIAGHRAVGRFEPGLWTAYYLDEQPAAVLLLNPLIDRPELELVYLGLAPAFRGQGLGKRLMERALLSARQRDHSGLHLAVDQQNTPAMRLYKGLGFRASGRKMALIHVL